MYTCDILHNDGEALFCPNYEHCCATAPKTTDSPTTRAPPIVPADQKLFAILYGVTGLIMLIFIHGLEMSTFSFWHFKTF